MDFHLSFNKLLMK